MSMPAPFTFDELRLRNYLYNLKCDFKIVYSTPILFNI